MGHLNQLTFAQRHREKFRAPFLEIGSRDYGSTMNLRDVFGGDEYVGIDMLEGKSVDLVLDLTLPFEEVDAALGGKRFGSVFCLSVLEHCSQPFTMASTISKLLEPGGTAYISVPYAWVFHGYPSDYWRFTHEGVKKLFPDLAFAETDCAFSTDIDGDFRPLDNELSRIHFSTSWHRKRGHRLAWSDQWVTSQHAACPLDYVSSLRHAADDDRHDWHEAHVKVPGLPYS